MNAILDAFARMRPGEAVAWLFAVNVLLFVLALVVGEILVRLFGSQLVGPAPPPVDRREIALAASCVLFNTVVNVIGWWMWRSGYLTIRLDTGVRAWLDALVLLVMMDLAMYVTHRLAHLPWIYRLVHATHHKYDRPRPLDLFVLSPLEVLGFGGLWLAILWVYSASWLGIVVYLTLNLAFGLVGHLGVEPFPRSWASHRVLKYLGTSTFHAGHHQDGRGNFGFYTLIWDRMFGTLHPGNAGRP